MFIIIFYNFYLILINSKFVIIYKLKYSEWNLKKESAKELDLSWNLIEFYAQEQSKGVKENETERDRVREEGRQRWLQSSKLELAT